MVSKYMSESEVKEILDYIGDDFKTVPYLYADVVKYGAGAPNVRTWIDRASDDSLRGVYLLYYDCLHFFTRDDDGYPMETFLTPWNLSIPR